MVDIIIGDEDTAGKKGVRVEVLDVSTLPTSAQDDNVYVNPSKHYGSLNRNPSLNWDKTTRSLDIVRQQQSLSRKHLEPKVDVIIGDKVLPFMPESREASKALLKKWVDNGPRHSFPIHLGQKKDVIVDDLKKDFDGDVFNIEQLWDSSARRQPKKTLL